MQDAFKGQASPRKQNAQDIPPRPMKVTDVTESIDDIEASNVLWKQDAQKKLDLVDQRRAQETSDTQFSQQSDDKFGSVDRTETFEARDALDAPHSAEAIEAEEQIAAAHDAMEITDARTIHHTPLEPLSMKTPLLAIAAAVALLAAGWNYSALEAARAELTTVTQAKATVDSALAEAQSRLTAAEEAVANVKAALSATPGAAVPKKAAPAAAEPKTDADTPPAAAPADNAVTP